MRIIEMDTAESGLKQNETLIGKVLRSMNKFLAVNRIKLWLDHNRLRFKNGRRGNIQVAEFLSLAANAEDRLKKILDLPTSKMSLNKQKISQTYDLDEGLNHNRAPDNWLQVRDETNKHAQVIKWDLDDDRWEK